MNKHRDAVAAFEQGDSRKSLRLFEELLEGDATSEIWNDWATVQSACADPRKAETGFLRALELDAQNHQAKANLGLLLIGLGEHARAIPLLEGALFMFPEQERELLRAALATAKEKAGLSAAATIQESAASILLVHDVFPQLHSHGSEPRFIQIAGMLRKLGQAVTLIVRDGRNCDRCQHALQKLGVRVFSGDDERLRSLGHEARPSDWSLTQLLTEDGFALAFLTQNFERGISIPEHYLDDIRHYSPATRIAILSDDPHGRNAASRFAASGEFRHHQVAENWSQREKAAFHRADLVIVPSERDAEWLRHETAALEIGVVSSAQNRSAPATDQLAKVIGRALRLTAKPSAPSPFSVNVVESIFSSLLQNTTGENRVYARLDLYIKLAEQLLRQGQPQFAREQLRHIFGWLGDSIKSAPALAQPLSLLARCYSQLHDDAMAVRCSEEARRCFSGLSTAAQPEAALPVRHHNRPLLSLIVPSYNRLPILKKCLAALEAQTVSPELFEVIVIDDGSSDATEAFMREYRPAFRLQYLRQSNSGTGAARRNGVDHATGEYLLLMNDDTICDARVLEEHLKAHQNYSSQKWAVLGDFEYPVEARRRALTHFLRTHSFMFPQVDMTAGCPYAYSHFITCNLSIRRDAVLRAGSFDPTYKLSEDTELGIRLFEMGYGVIYHPAAHAWHDHLPYAVPDLIRRARVYGADYFYMFRNHPRVMKEWAMPIKVQGIDEQDAASIRAYLAANRAEVEAAVAAMERWDVVAFEPVLANPQEATHVLSLFQQAVPAVHWFYLFESMLETMVKELRLPHLDAEERLARAAPGS